MPMAVSSPWNNDNLLIRGRVTRWMSQSIQRSPNNRSPPWNITNTLNQCQKKYFKELIANAPLPPLRVSSPYSVIVTPLAPDVLRGCVVCCGLGGWLRVHPSEPFFAPQMFLSEACVVLSLRFRSPLALLLASGVTSCRARAIIAAMTTFYMEISRMPLLQIRRRQATTLLSRWRNSKLSSYVNNFNHWSRKIIFWNRIWGFYIEQQNQS